MDIKMLFKGLINKAGYDMRKLNTANSLRTSSAESYALMNELGFVPETVIDVGIAKGTPELYEAFPKSYFLLIEPLEEFESTMKSILKKYNGTYSLSAAGSEKGELVLNVHPQHLDGSSLLKESMGTEADGYERSVPIVRIDDLVNDKKLKGPFLIKIDVQGAELNVLDGCSATLKETEAVVLEVSMFKFMKGAPVFNEVIEYMKNKGFVAYDIIFGWNRPLDNALGQVDIVFVKENGRFRKDHSYSTVEQMEKIFGN
jgi:FkbM family methyltransferase